ncbi:Rv3235 family protein [Streptomyces sp. NPDC047108]|uniref:Rv3235 family protein n=1 Tax=Streptomyces sp. NPDC047108 TaxID=3155025 RepID=UPI0033DE6E20
MIMDHTRRRPPGRATDRRTESRTESRRAAGRQGPGRGPLAGPGRGPVTGAGVAPPRRGDAVRPPGRPGPGGGPPSGGAAAALRRRERDRQPRYWFAHRLLLVLSGAKPVHWMLGHTLGAAYDQLVQLAPLMPLRPTTGPGGRSATPVVTGCGEYRPAPGVIEAFARVRSGDRLRAVAFRLERGRDERWRCSAVELGGPPTQPSGTCQRA